MNGTVSVRPVRRGTVAIEQPDALPRYAEAISRLAERAVEPNPFFLPEFLQPAIEALGTRKLRLAVFFDQTDVRFFAPVRVLRGGALRIWTHPYAPLGTPLIDRDGADQIADGLLAHLHESGRSLLAIPHLPLLGPAAAVLRDSAGRRGYSLAAARYGRPVLDAEGGDAAAFDRCLPKKRQHELGRQLRRLSETGPVSVMTARLSSEVEAAFGLFTSLEESGWKGRRGTALNRNKKIAAFARTAVLDLARNGRVAIDIMRSGETPVAGIIRIEHAGLSVPWKIAYDEAYAGYSPGKQLMCDETRRWLADPAIRRVDPVCDDANPLMSYLWSSREPYGTMLISTRKWALGPRVKAGTMTLLRDVKRAVRGVTRRVPRRAKRSGPA